MKKNKKNILIIGAGVAGIELLDQINRNLKKIYQVVGFIDDDPKKSNKKIKKLPILGTTKNLSQVIRKNHVSEVFIAIPSAQGESIRQVIEQCQKEKVLFKIVPRLLEIVLGEVKLQKIREVQIEDLLGRPIIKTEQSILVREFQGRKILVTGAAGSIGSELCKQLIQLNPKLLIAFDIWESGLFDLETDIKSLGLLSKCKIVIGNIQDYSRLQQVLKEFKPEIIFHAAAYKHVPLMQENIAEAIKNNIFGTENVAKAALKLNVKKVINISTDKAADPSSIMGTTKLIGENLMKFFNNFKKTKYISVRFGNVLDSQGSVVPIFRKQIKEGGPVTVTDSKMTRFFMTIPEAVQLVLQAAILGKGGEIFVLDMGKPIRIEELAKLMIRLAGFIPGEEIPIKFIGKRPGEKTHEVLISKKEYLLKTKNQKIFKVRQRFQRDVKFSQFFDNLRDLLIDQSNEKMTEALKKIVPNLR